MKLTKFGKCTKIGALTLGAVMLLGTTGALELGDISLTQALAQYAVGVFSSLLGLYIVSLEKQTEETIMTLRDKMLEIGVINRLEENNYNVLITLLDYQSPVSRCLKSIKIYPRNVKKSINRYSIVYRIK